MAVLHSARRIEEIRMNVLSLEYKTVLALNLRISVIIGGKPEQITLLPFGRSS